MPGRVPEDAMVVETDDGRAGGSCRSGGTSLGAEPPGVRVVVHAFRFVGNEPAGALLRSLGHTPVRVFRDIPRPRPRRRRTSPT
jgi:hypothetical protein